MNLSGLAIRKGLEPSTSCVTGRRSNQLNYRTDCNPLILNNLETQPLIL